MQHDMTDKEQADQLKQWAKEYGVPLGLAILVGLGGSWGWRTWQAKKLEASMNASNLYASMQVLAYEKKTAKVDTIAQQLRKDYAKSIYAGMGQLVDARLQAQANNDAAATTALQWILNNETKPVLKDMAYLNLAAVKTQQKQNSAALNDLNKVSAIYAPIVWQQKSIVYRQMKQNTKAIAALTKAKALYAQYKLANPLLDVMLAQYPIGANAK